MRLRSKARTGTTKVKHCTDSGFHSSQVKAGTVCESRLGQEKDVRKRDSIKLPLIIGGRGIRNELRP